MYRVLFFALLALAPSCRALATDIRNIESLDDAQFGRLQAKCAAIVSLGMGPLLRAETVDAAKLTDVADTLDALGSGVLSTDGFISDALREQGFTEPEIIGIFLLAEDALAEAGIRLDFTQPGPRASALLHTLADTVRAVAGPPAPEGEPTEPDPNA